MGILDRILRAGEGKKLKALAGPRARHQRARARDARRSPTTRCRPRPAEFRQRLDNGEDLDDLLIEAFAVVREAASRAIGQRHYDVQLMGGAALHFGWVAEMKTGEGKTLVSTLPAYLNGLTGKGVHLITVNDYLARRDAEWMGRIHRWLGLERRPDHPRRLRPASTSARSTRCDITYGTNNEFGFDYLRDNMATTLDRQGAARPQLRDRRRGRLDPHRRGPHAADHLAAGSPTPPSSTTSSPAIVRGLQARRRLRGRRGEAHRRPDSRTGIEKVEQALGVENLYDEVQQNLVHQLHGGAEGQGALQAGQGLHHPARRGEDRRRVHRPHPRGPALVARACTRRSRPRRA